MGAVLGGKRCRFVALGESVRRSVRCLVAARVRRERSAARVRANQTPSQANEEIIVTGSRVSQQGFDSPQPLTTIDNEQIQNLGIVNTGDVLRTLPQNTPFFTETNVGIGNFNVGAQLANLRGLNPFFGTRTLTLVDTRRVVPSTEGGAVDLTLIPSMLVQRTEVVTGGASAAYGSDAIAGVVNVILDKKLEGFKAQIDYGETSEGDGGDTHASFAWGTGILQQRSRPRDARHRVSEAGHDRPLLADPRLVQGSLGHRQQRTAYATGERGTAEFRTGAGREADAVGERHHFALHDRGVYGDLGAAHLQSRRHGALGVQSGRARVGLR